MWNVMKFHQVEVALFQYNRWTGGHDKMAVVTFRNCFAKQWRSWLRGVMWLVPRGGKMCCRMNMLIKKNMGSTYFALLSKIKRYSRNCDLLKIITCERGGHFDTRKRRWKRSYATGAKCVVVRTAPPWISLFNLLRTVVRPHLHNVHSKILLSRNIFSVVWPRFYDAGGCDAIRTSYNGELYSLPCAEICLATMETSACVPRSPFTCTQLILEYVRVKCTCVWRENQKCFIQRRCQLFELYKVSDEWNMY